MRKKLMEKLHSYIVTNNPDLILGLQENLSVTSYLEEKMSRVDPMLEALLKEGKPAYIIEELCMNELMKDLRPSKFNYIKEILETEFEDKFKQFRENGILTYEIVNMIAACRPVFDDMQFSEDNDDDRMLRYAIMGIIQEYLERR